MIKTPVVVKTEAGFDGRPIALLVQEASQYASKIYIQIGEKNINAKSIMGLMVMNLEKGMAVEIEAEGKDEQEAASAMEKFLGGQYQREV